MLDVNAADVYSLACDWAKATGKDSISCEALHNILAKAQEMEQDASEGMNIGNVLELVGADVTTKLVVDDSLIVSGKPYNLQNMLNSKILAEPVVGISHNEYAIVIKAGKE